MGGAEGHLWHSRPPPGRTRGSHRQQPPSTKTAPRGTWSGRPGLRRSPRLPHRHTQSHAARAPGTRSPPQHAGKADPNPPGAHRAPRGAPPTRSRRRAPWGRGHRANQRGRRRRPQKAEPGSGPDGAANSVEAGEPLGEERIGRRRAGKRGTRQARSQGATGTRARGTRGGLLGQKTSGTAGPPGKHGHGIPPPQTRGRSRGAPPGTPNGPWATHRATPLTSPGSCHRGPRSNLSHKPNTRGHISLVSRPSRTRSRSGRPAHPPWGRLAPQEPGGPTPRHANAVTDTGRGSAQERAESRLTAASRAGRSATRTRRSRQPSQSARTSGPAQRDPPPTRKGEARATVDDEPHARPPPRGPAEPSPFPQPHPVEGGAAGEGSLQASRYGSATTTQREAAGRGIRYPKARLSDR